MILSISATTLYSAGHQSPHDRTHASHSDCDGRDGCTSRLWCRPLKTHTDYIAVIVLTALAIGLVLLLSGCSSLNASRQGDSVIKVDVEGTITKLQVECGADYTQSFGETENITRGK